MKGELLMAMFDKEYESDDESFSNKGDRLLRDYKNANLSEKKVINDTIITLCGWTIPTLIKLAKENKDDLISSYGIEV